MTVNIYKPRRNYYEDQIKSNQFNEQKDRSATYIDMREYM